MKYGPEMTHEISTLLSNGSGRVDACALVDISYETFTQWMKIAEFSEAIKKAEATCKQRNITIIQKAAIKTWTAAAWWLERKHPDEFGLRNRETDEDKEVPQRMAERAAELLKKMEGHRATASGTNGNGPVHS